MQNSTNSNGSVNTKNDVWLKLVFVFFISLLSFSVGTFVGKKFSDNQAKIQGGSHSEIAHDTHEKASAHDSEGHTAEHANTHGEPSSAEGHGTADHETTGAANEVQDKALTDEEVAQFAKEFLVEGVSREPAAAAPDTTHAAETSHEAAKTAHPAEKKSDAHSAHHAPEKVTAENTQKLVVPVIKESPAAIAQQFANLSPAKYSLQVGAFLQKVDAEKKAEEVKAQGLSAQVIQANRNGQSWYRVMVGVYTTKEEASKNVNDVQSKAKILEKPFVQKID